LRCFSGRYSAEEKSATKEIDSDARQEWIRCFRAAFVAHAGLGLSLPEQKQFLDWIELFSGWMVNKK